MGKKNALTLARSPRAGGGEKPMTLADWRGVLLLAAEIAELHKEPRTAESLRRLADEIPDRSEKEKPRQAGRD